jgi:hypothetical protein
VLVVVSDSAPRLTLLDGCRAAGAAVLAVTSIAEVERWPVGQIVITDSAHLTPLWRTVGAREVIVLAESAEEGMAGFQNGATGWLQPPTSPAAVTAMIVGLDAGCA